MAFKSSAQKSFLTKNKPKEFAVKPKHVKKAGPKAPSRPISNKIKALI